MSLDDDILLAFEAVAGLPDLRFTTFQTAGGGATARPFKVVGQEEDALLVKTSRGGTISLRAEAFSAALKVLSDLAPDDPQGWVRTSDERLVGVLQGENRDKACSSYVLPLLAAAGKIELDRGRPSRARLTPT